MSSVESNNINLKAEDEVLPSTSQSSKEMTSTICENEPFDYTKVGVVWDLDTCPLPDDEYLVDLIMKIQSVVMDENEWCNFDYFVFGSITKLNLIEIAEFKECDIQLFDADDIPLQKLFSKLSKEIEAYMKGSTNSKLVLISGNPNYKYFLRGACEKSEKLNKPEIVKIKL